MAQNGIFLSGRNLAFRWIGRLEAGAQRQGLQAAEIVRPDISRGIDKEEENDLRQEELRPTPDRRLVSPSAERNKGPVADVLKSILPLHGKVIEISSGTGQHVVHFAREMPGLTWQPSECDEPSLKSIER